ncbi:MAG: riboflavin biosynthesis protein RibF [Pygmaiobacter massiliensis]|nr:riboflavin biosynthesis protein RibF [Pygmaiobacter massiliensis]
MIDLTEKQQKKTAVALGYFDGVHLGHRKVLAAACEAARQCGLQSAVFTFWFDGVKTIKGERVVSAEERRRRIEHCGIELFYCPEYESFKNLTPEQFVQQVLVEKMNAAAVFTGDNFTFGRGGKGNVQLLGQLCRQVGIEHTIVEMQAADGSLVSSSRIRKLLAQGDIAHANWLLGEAYAVTLPVQAGKGIGSGKLGFPTINQIYPAGLLRPKEGVYLSCAWVDGVRYPAATGIGSQPTVGGTQVTCESYLVGYEGNLYGRPVRLELYEYLEPVQRFENLDQLRRCIADAAQRSVKYFENHPQKTLQASAGVV